MCDFKKRNVDQMHLRAFLIKIITNELHIECSVNIHWASGDTGGKLLHYKVLSTSTVGTLVFNTSYNGNLLSDHTIRDKKSYYSFPQMTIRVWK